MKYVTAILLAAGKGARCRSKCPKPLIKVCGKPLISYSLRVLNRHPAVKDIIVVVNKSNRNAISSLVKNSIGKVSDIILGGRERQDSVANALMRVSKETEIVLIHDAARPFITKEMVTVALECADKNGAAITGVPVKDTIKEVISYKFEVKGHPVVKRTLDRHKLWGIQTPQVFRKDLIINAYRRFGRQRVTDDASWVEKLGKKVSIVMGSYLNIKITTLEDLVLAESIARII